MTDKEKIKNKVLNLNFCAKKKLRQNLTILKINSNEIDGRTGLNVKKKKNKVNLIKFKKF